MMFWITATASVLALPMLFRWRGRFVYVALLLYTLFGLFCLAVHDMFRPDNHGSPGDALGLAIAMLFIVTLVVCLLLATLIPMLVACAHRRLRRPPSRAHRPTARSRLPRPDLE